MPIARAQMPDGRIARFDVPQGMTADDVVAYIHAITSGEAVPGGTTEAQRRMDRTNALIQQAQANPEFNPTDDMGAGERFAAGAGSELHRMGQALLQPTPLVSQQDIDASAKLDQPLRDTPAGAAGAFTAAALPYALASTVPGANTVPGAALMGATGGFALTPGDPEARAGAALAAGAGGAAGAAVPWAARTARALYEPTTEAGQGAILGRVLNRVAGQNADDVAARMAGAAELVPGSQPTAAEVAESGGVAALQRAMRSAAPEDYTHREMAQAAARAAALRGIGQDEAALAGARGARADATRPLFEAFGQSRVTGDPALDAIMQRVPDGIRATAERLAAVRGEPLQLAEASPAGPSAYRGSGLQYLKLAIDDALNPRNAAAVGLESHEGQALASLRRDLVGWLDRNAPEYGRANALYRDLSAPVNQMQVGQELADRLTPALADHGALARETGNRYALALRNANQTARAATGMDRGLEDVMTPEQMQTLQAVAADLARKANAQDLGRGAGSNTFQNFAMDNIAAQSGMPRAVGNLLSAVPGMGAAGNVVRGVARLVYGNAEDVMRQRMAQALLSPQAAAQLMRQQMPRETARRLPMLARALLTSPGYAGAAAAQTLYVPAGQE